MEDAENSGSEYCIFSIIYVWFLYFDRPMLHIVTVFIQFKLDVLKLLVRPEENEIITSSTHSKLTFKGGRGFGTLWSKLVWTFGPKI